jgi:replicative DNA helicase
MTGRHDGEPDSGSLSVRSTTADWLMGFASLTERTLMKRRAKSEAAVASTVPDLVLLGEGGAEDVVNGPPEEFVPSGLASLDNLILGAVAGEVLLIAGDAGRGKTSLAMQWAIGATEAGVPAAVLSLEMGKRALRNRLISGLTGIEMQVLRTKKWVSPKQKQLAAEAAEYLASLPLYADDRGGLDGQKVYDTIVTWKEQGIKLVVVDYLQQMTGDNESRVTQVGDAIRKVKEAAKATDIPIILLSSLNRQGSQSTGTPKRSWLRDSGDIEFVSDTILMLHYPEEDENEDIRICDIHCVKQRNGPTGVASVRFNKRATRFEPI